MPKKNYTKAGARRALTAAETKVRKVYEDGHMTVHKYVSLADALNKLKKSIK